MLKKLRWYSLSLALIVLFAAIAAAQETTPPAQTNPSSQEQQAPQKETKQEKKEREKKEKEAKKLKEKQEKEAKKKAEEARKKQERKSEPQDTFNTEVFSDRVANNVLGLIRDGLEGHDQRLMESAFDGDQMDGYLSFEDQIESFFNRYVGFRVHIRIIQTSMEGSKGVVLTEFQLEGMPRDMSAGTLRRSDQLRFVLERGRKGWRIVDFSPRGFFN